MTTANRDQETGDREWELGFVILNEVTYSVLCKNLKLSQQGPHRLRGTDLTYYDYSRDGVAVVT